MWSETMSWLEAKFKILEGQFIVGHGCNDDSIIVIIIIIKLIHWEEEVWKTGSEVLRQFNIHTL